MVLVIKRVILAIKFGLICSHGIHYFLLQRENYKAKLACAQVNFEMKDVAPVVPAVLQIPAFA